MKKIENSVILSNTNTVLGKITNNKTNYEIIENKQVIAISKSHDPVKDFVLNKYPDNFKQTLVNDVELLNNSDLIVSGQVQIGKTSVITTMAWMSLYCRNEIPIIISWNLLSVMSQTLSRIHKFDQDIKDNYPSSKSLLNPKVIKSSLTSIEIGNLCNNPTCLITILQPGRLDSIGAIIRQGHSQGIKFRIIIDESDHSIKGSETATEMKILQNFISTPQNNLISIAYVSATNFAIYNSINRFSSRRYRVITIPNNIYEKMGLEYRSHKSFEKMPTNYLIGLNKLEEVNDEQWSNFIELLRGDFALMKVIPENREDIQPNIGLLDVSFKNEPKEDLALRISKELPYVHVVVYMSPHSKIYHEGNKYHQFSESMCIGDILDEFKNTYKSQMRAPILIISTGLSGRAQTFKTSDNEWVLTHHFLNKSTTAVDVLVQALRGCGQYKPTDPKIKFYASQDVITSLETSWYNNNKLTTKIAEFQDVEPMRDIIEKVSFVSYGKPVKFVSRKNIDDTTFAKVGKDYNAVGSSREDIFRKAEMIRATNGCDGILEIARLYYLPIKIYHRLIETCSEDLKQVQTEKLNTDEPFKNMNKSLQSRFRQAIKDEIMKLSNLNIDKCQLCYNVSRQKDLNKLHHLKTHSNFKAQVIALSCNNKNDIPLVIYDKNYLDAFSDLSNPDPKGIFSNKVLIWPSTDETFKCYANSNNGGVRVNLFQLKH
jgi:hypothetical protein